MLSLTIIIWGVLGGIALGTLYSILGRRVPGLFVRALKRAQAETPDKAVTLADIGMEKNLFLKHALKNGKPLRKYALLANEADFAVKKPDGSKFSRVMRAIFSLPEAEERVLIDFDTARFYMPTEERYTAEVRYNGKGADLTGAILAIILLVALGFFLQWVLPELLGILTEFADKLGTKPGHAAFGQGGLVAVEKLGADKAQNGVTQKLKPLIAQRAVVLFVGVGAVGQRGEQKLFIFEFMSYFFLEFIHMYHSLLSFIYSIFSLMSAIMPEFTKAMVWRTAAKILSALEEP